MKDCDLSCPRYAGPSPCDAAPGSLLCSTQSVLCCGLHVCPTLRREGRVGWGEEGGVGRGGRGEEGGEGRGGRGGERREGRGGRGGEGREGRGGRGGEGGEGRGGRGEEGGKRSPHSTCTLVKC